MNCLKNIARKSTFWDYPRPLKIFKFNTLENTTLLLNEKKLVGETKKAFETHADEFQLSDVGFSPLQWMF